MNKFASYGLNKGFGVFGERGFRIGSYRIDVMHQNGSIEGGTIFSLKQGVKGGNLLRWDYGPLHNSRGLGLHSTFRFNIRESTYGSSAQYPWYAPFKFWKYKK
ncbi:hypothetical protein D3C72_1864740 [compost metagenome]